MHDIIDNKVEQQRQAKLCKGSAGEITTPYRYILLFSNKAKFCQLSSFIPAYPISSNFLYWTIKASFDLNTNATNSDLNIKLQAKIYQILWMLILIMSMTQLLDLQINL